MREQAPRLGGAQNLVGEHGQDPVGGGDLHRLRVPHELIDAAPDREEPARPLRHVPVFDGEPTCRPGRLDELGGPVAFRVGDLVRRPSRAVTHEKLPNQAMLDGISAGWPAVLANLKTLLETGDVLPRAPWEMTAAHA
jgi:hypothetical protein